MKKLLVSLCIAAAMLAVSGNVIPVKAEESALLPECLRESEIMSALEYQVQCEKVGNSPLLVKTELCRMRVKIENEEFWVYAHNYSVTCIPPTLQNPKAGLGLKK